MPVTTDELDPQGLSKLHYNAFGAVFEFGPLSTGVVASKTTTIDLLRVAELIGAPVEYARLWVEGSAGTAPSTAVTTLRSSPNGETFFPTAEVVTGVSAAAPSVVDVRGVPYIDAAITTAEASDSVHIWITLYGAR